MKIIEILDKLKQKPPIPLTEEIRGQIEKIRDLCDKKYCVKRTYGEDALNRMILLDKEIAKLLTPEVIQFLFTQKKPTANEQTIRDDRTIRNIRDVIYYGFINGLLPIKFLPNNEPTYGLTKYQQKQANYEENTLSIVRNIVSAAGVDLSQIEPLNESSLYESSLSTQFEVITGTINMIAPNETLRKELIKVNTFTFETIISQADTGFEALRIAITDKLKNEDQQINLDSFCEAFLNDPELILDADIGHSLLDRVHMEAAILSNKKITVGEKEYTYQEILREMVKKISDNPNKYPPSAKQQLFLRFSIVENDLKNRFNEQFQLNNYMKNYNSLDEYQQEKVVKYFTGMILSSNENNLQIWLKKNNPDLYKAVGAEIKDIYNQHVKVLTEHRDTLVKRVLKADTSSILGDREVITDKDKKTVSKSILNGEIVGSFSPDYYDSTTKINELLVHANTINTALNKAIQVLPPQDSVDELSLYRSKMATIKGSLEKKDERLGVTGFDILKKDTSSSWSQLKRFILNMVNLFTPAFLHEYAPPLQHKGHRVEKEFELITNAINRFKEIKLQFKEVIQSENIGEEENKDEEKHADLGLGA
ncbi:hypothetical protein [Legionella maioricensis]|uniref:Uncharacterized protein n=1 Tax=Legionella maioricensis TaxID=2896528 RepID=A0A9X2D046_9GAMM|nr:hypothetical protein [Legionella maioricensis]MCL9683968.1 hypothetical protein [Legionella maioricensis]MCL9687987.1 hypothetical protein [Legionella maioricensis]